MVTVLEKELPVSGEQLQSFRYDKTTMVFLLN